MAVQLYQFRFSHFNEKARWALDLKQVPHERTSLLPGPHMGKIKRLTGKTQTPVLDLDGELVQGSANILAALDSRWPEPPLFPQDPGQRQAVEQWQDQLDRDLGPNIRIVAFAALLDAGRYLPDMFSQGQPWLARQGYAWTWPLVKGLVKKGNGVTGPAAIAQATSVMETCLAGINSAQSAGNGYLVASTFTAADLTAAALLAPLASPDHPAMRRPEPLPPAVQELQQRWGDHPAMVWARHIYRQHRPAAMPGVPA